MTYTVTINNADNLDKTVWADGGQHVGVLLAHYVVVNQKKSDAVLAKR